MIIYLIFRGDFILLVLIIAIIILLSPQQSENKTTLTFKEPADVKTFDFNDWVNQSIKTKQKQGDTSFLFQIKW